MKRLVLLAIAAVVLLLSLEPSIVRLHDSSFAAEAIDVFVRTWKIRISELQEMRMRLVYQLEKQL